MVSPNPISLDAFFQNNPNQAGISSSGSRGGNGRQPQNDRPRQLPYRPVFIFDASLARESSKEQVMQQANATLQLLYTRRQDDSSEKPLVFVAQRPEHGSITGRPAPTSVRLNVQTSTQPAPRLQDHLTPQYDALIAAVDCNDVATAKRYLSRDNNMRWSEATLSRLLHIAAKKGFHETLMLLLRNSAPVNMKDKDHDTPLLIAARKGHKDIVNILLLSEAEIRAMNGSKRTALHEACGEGHLDVVELLLGTGAEADPIDLNGETPLQLAVMKGRSAVVNVLCHRADVNRAYQDGRFPLHVAASQGSVPILRNLLNAGAALKPPTQLPSPLYLSISHKQTEAMRLLLEHGAVVTEVDSHLDTALHVAARAGHFAAIVPLLENGCPPKSKNASNQTALHLAVLGGSVTTTRLLLGDGNSTVVGMDEKDAIIEAVKAEKSAFLALFLSRGANVHQQDPSGKTLLHLALESRRPGNVALLLVYGAALDAQNSSGQTPLMFAMERKSLDMVKIILEHDRMNIDTPCAGGYTPLVFAIKKGIPAVINTILEKGADIEWKGTDGRTPLHIAIESGYTQAAECLLKAGADPNARNMSGQTPLHRLVVGCGKETLVHLLVKHGADVEANAKDGSTPLFLADMHSKLAIIEALVFAGAKKRNGDNRESASAFLAAVQAGNAQTAKMYLEHGVNVHQKTADGNSPIGLAAVNGHTDVVKTLLDHGAGIETSDASAETPLIAAVSNRHTSTIKLLLARGANVEANSPSGMRPLHHACDGKTENANIVEILLKRKAKVNERFISPRGTRSKTALHFAAINGWVDTVRVLLDYGADLGAKSHTGKTARDLAFKFHGNGPEGRALKKLLTRSKR